jgi:hypothetical protein
MPWRVTEGAMFDKLFGLKVLGVERDGRRAPEDDDMWTRPDAEPDPLAADDARGRPNRGRTPNIELGAGTEATASGR